MSVVAVRLLTLKEQARVDPQAPAERSGLQPEELHVLAAATERQLTTTGEVILAVGRLGGHMNRKGDGLPGWQTLWRGMTRLATLVEGYRLGRGRFGNDKVGWASDTAVPTALVARAFERTVHGYRPIGESLHHSDCGRQYTSDTYRDLLRRHCATPSMNCLANCYNNVRMESFWTTLKGGSIGDHVFATRTEAKTALFDYSRSSTTGGSSTAPSASNPLWTMKTT